MAITVRQASWPEEKTHLRDIRNRVFVEEQKVPKEIEWDDLDDSSIHFLAYSGKQAVGTARLLPTGQFGRMAVIPSARQLGIGKEILQLLKQYASRHNLKLFCHAQVSALGFYEKYGFVPEGDRFYEAGIEHQTMRLSE